MSDPLRQFVQISRWAYDRDGVLRLLVSREVRDESSDVGRRIECLCRNDGGDLGWRNAEYFVASAPDEGLILYAEDAQRIVDQLWTHGYRPQEAIGSAGALTATAAHLADMRKQADNLYSMLSGDLARVAVNLADCPAGMNRLIEVHSKGFSDIEHSLGGIERCVEAIRDRPAAIQFPAGVAVDVASGDDSTPHWAKMTLIRATPVKPGTAEFAIRQEREAESIAAGLRYDFPSNSWVSDAG